LQSGREPALSTDVRRGGGVDPGNNLQQKSGPVGRLP
jgi:hypothetical protein